MDYNAIYKGERAEIPHFLDAYIYELNRDTKMGISLKYSNYHVLWTQEKSDS